MRSPHTATREQPLLATTREKLVPQQRPSIAKNKSGKKKKKSSQNKPLVGGGHSASWQCGLLGSGKLAFNFATLKTSSSSLSVGLLRK